MQFGQYILNVLGASARLAADFDVLARLPQRYFDDAGMSAAELGVARPAVDPVYLRISPVAFGHSAS